MKVNFIGFDTTLVTFCTYRVYRGDVGSRNGRDPHRKEAEQESSPPARPVSPLNERPTMSRIMCVATPEVKPVRRTARPVAPFGSGLVRFIPFAVSAPGFIEPSDEGFR
jgi:hypothetical protein